MSTRRLVVLSMLLALAGMACQASAAISLNYLGAFNTGMSSVYNGDLTYCPDGNGGAGSLVLVDYPANATGVAQVTIPALVNTSDVSRAEHGERTRQLQRWRPRGGIQPR